MSTRRDRAKAVARAVAARVESEPLLGEQRDDAEKDVEAGGAGAPGDGGQRGRKGLGGVAAARTAERRGEDATDSNTEALYMVCWTTTRMRLAAGNSVRAPLLRGLMTVRAG